MTKSKIIETKRLLIMPFKKKHLTAQYVSWLNDPEVVQYSEQRFKTHSFESCQEYMNSFDKTPHYFWAIVGKDSQVGHIGNISAYVDPSNKLSDISIMIGEKEQWGKGYGLEAFSAVVDILFREAEMRKVTAGTLSVNHGMLKIIQRIGMEEDGKRIRHFICEGREVDLVHSAIFKTDWLKTNI